MKEIHYVYRCKGDPCYNEWGYGWDLEMGKGRMTWVFRLDEIRQDPYAGALHRGYHPDIKPVGLPEMDDYKDFGWSIYWFEYSRQGQCNE